MEQQALDDKTEKTKSVEEGEKKKKAVDEVTIGAKGGKIKNKERIRDGLKGARIQTTQNTTFLNDSPNK